MQPHALERSMRLAPHDCGVFTDREIPLRQFQTAIGTPIGTSTSSDVFVKVDTSGTGCEVVDFEFDADASDVLLFEYTLPSTFKVKTPTSDPYLTLFIQARKMDASDENTDLAIKAGVAASFNLNASAMTSAQATFASATLQGSTAVGTLTAIDFYKLDIVAAMTAAERALLKPGMRIRLQINPSETVGTTDMTLLVYSVIVRTLNHLQPGTYGTT